MSDKTYRERVESLPQADVGRNRYAIRPGAITLAADADAELAACRLRIAELQSELDQQRERVEFHKAMTGDAQRVAASANVRIAELETDAGRYRWMRSDGLSHIRWEGFTDETCDVGLDAAIDAAARNSKKESST